MLAAQAIPKIRALEPTHNSDRLKVFVGGAVANQGYEAAAVDPVRAATRLKRSARGALSTIAPLSVIAERTFKGRDARFVMLATTLPHGRRVPRSPDLIRLAIASGAGLRLRAIGRLAVVVLKLPLASENAP